MARHTINRRSAAAAAEAATSRSAMMAALGLAFGLVALWALLCAV